MLVVMLLIGLVLAGMKIAQLSARIKELQDEAARERKMFTVIARAFRDRLDRPGSPLDRPDGYVTGVDRELREVVVGVTRGQGAVPRLRMMILDSGSPSIPTARTKGLIELTRVDEQSATARIIQMTDDAPIRVGDIVYSPIWSPDLPTRFALIGMIDASRDSKDDRVELKRTIQTAGGIVDFDLPPPEVGEETGLLSPVIDWYVVDDRGYWPAQPAKRIRDVLKEARLDGIRPMPIERLLDFLGYGTRQPHFDRPRARN
jgi:hypothetical protein